MYDKVKVLSLCRPYIVNTNFLEQIDMHKKKKNNRKQNLNNIIKRKIWKESDKHNEPERGETRKKRRNSNIFK